MDSLASSTLVPLLRVNGRFPRRAVLTPDGRLADKTALPDHAEVDLLSRICEVVKHAAGLKVYPRQTAALLERALADNDPGAWEALKDDLVTGDVDLDSACAVLRQGNCAALVACLVGARSPAHMMHVACLLAKVLGGLGEEARADLGRALCCQLRGVMDALLAHGAMMTREVVDGVVGGFGAIIGQTCTLPDGRVAELVAYALSKRRDELLRLFLEAPPSFVDHRPEVFQGLLDRAKAAPPAHKFPTVAMLAKLVRYRPELAAGHEARLTEIVCAALPDQFDCRECLAAATLVVATSGNGGTEILTRALARALQQCSATLVARRSQV